MPQAGRRRLSQLVTQLSYRAFARCSSPGRKIAALRRNYPADRPAMSAGKGRLPGE
jgi:hypothetical protein